MIGPQEGAGSPVESNADAFAIPCQTIFVSVPFNGHTIHLKARRVGCSNEWKFFVRGETVLDWDLLPLSMISPFAGSVHRFLFQLGKGLLA